MAVGAAGRLAQVVDFDALEAAGLKNARDRAGILEYLDSLGFTAEEMIEADGRGRLFGLAGDVLQWSGRPVYSVRTAAEALGVSSEQVARAWALLGLTVAGPADQATLSQADVDALATWFEMKGLLGESGSIGFLRILGAAMARLAEAEAAVIRAVAPAIHIQHTGDELATAQAYRAAAEFTRVSRNSLMSCTATT